MKAVRNFFKACTRPCVREDGSSNVPVRIDRGPTAQDERLSEKGDSPAVSCRAVYDSPQQRPNARLLANYTAAAHIIAARRRSGSRQRIGILQASEARTQEASEKTSSSDYALEKLFATPSTSYRSVRNSSDSSNALLLTASSESYTSA